MENNKQNVRNLLFNLRNIDAQCKSIEDRNYARILQSFHTEKDTFDLMNIIIDKAYQTQRLQHQKRVALQTISRAPENFKEVLTLFFIKGKSLEFIAEATQKGERTISRHIANATEWFAENFTF